jgi:hypothetical protein
MQIELGYQLFIHACSRNYLKNIFSALFPLFFRFFCVKRLDDVSSCLDSKVASSGRPFPLPSQACLCDLLRGTTSGHHLSSVQTVIPPRRIPSHFILFGVFLSSCAFFSCFSCFFSCVFFLLFTCPLCNLSPTQVCFSTLLLFYIKFLCLK